MILWFNLLQQSINNFEYSTFLPNKVSCETRHTWDLVLNILQPYFPRVSNDLFPMFLFVVFSPSASKAKIKEAHKRVMLLNHPDKGTPKPECTL